MSAQEQQLKLLNAIDTLVSDRIDKLATAKNQVGVMVSTPTGYSCEVKINQEIIECHVPEHLHSWVQKDDIVMVQDTYGDGTLMMIVGKTGETQPNPSLVFYDSETGKNVSGVDMLVDTEDNFINYGEAVRE